MGSLKMEEDICLDDKDRTSQPVSPQGLLAMGMDDSTRKKCMFLKYMKFYQAIQNYSM
jgi:hypothetical protein